MHAGMIPAGLANTHPTERAVRRDKLVFSSTQVQKREVAVCFHSVLSRQDQPLFQFFALHKQQISIQHTSSRNHRPRFIPTASWWSNLCSSHTFSRSHHKFRHRSVNNNAALMWDFFVSFCVWQSEHQWLVDVGLIQEALAAVRHNYQGARSYTQKHKYTHLPWLAQKERLVWLVAVFTPKALY